VPRAPTREESTAAAAHGARTAAPQAACRGATRSAAAGATAGMVDSIAARDGEALVALIWKRI
jgi:hypothetical protein